MSPRAELTSVATGLDELVDRIRTIADELAGAERDSLGAGLFEVERALGSARRQLSKVVDAAGG